MVAQGFCRLRHAFGFHDASNQRRDIAVREHDALAQETVFRFTYMDDCGTFQRPSPYILHAKDNYICIYIYMIGVEVQPLSN